MPGFDLAVNGAIRISSGMLVRPVADYIHEYTERKQRNTLWTPATVTYDSSDVSG